MDYGIAHGGRIFTPNQTDVDLAENEARNRAIDAATLAKWANKPQSMVAYVNGGRVTTWMGAELGRVIRSSTYRNNLGARIDCLTVRATNGATYHGRMSVDWSQAIRLRKSKRIP
jgi:hypothetical protein